MLSCAFIQKDSLNYRLSLTVVHEVHKALVYMFLLTATREKGGLIVILKNSLVCSDLLLPLVKHHKINYTLMMLLSDRSFSDAPRTSRYAAIASSLLKH